MKCDVCGREPALGVASSCLGAISFAFCEECVVAQAEPEYMFEFVYHTTNYGEGAAEWLDGLNTWRAGKYESWTNWLEHVKQHPDQYPEPNYDGVMPEQEFEDDFSEFSGLDDTRQDSGSKGPVVAD